jgi:hypothetical protein
MDPKDTQAPGWRLVEAKRQIRELENLLGAEENRRRELTAELEAVYASTTWRLAAPLRWLVGKLRRLGRTKARVQMAGSAVENDVTDTGPLPAALLRRDLGGIDAANATCRRISLHPGLQGLVPEEVRAELAGNAQSGGTTSYGWRQDPPAICFIGSDELRIELSFDAKVTALDEDNWRDLLRPGVFRFLLVETVWHVSHRHWRYVLPGGDASGRFKALAEHCRRISLPIVVWFRETPAHYRHFAWLARYADLVCVVDNETVDRLRNDFPEARVECLPPAIQPTLHNPIRSYGLMPVAEALRDRIVFDGWWDLQRRPPETPQLDSLREHGLLVAESFWDFSSVRLGDSRQFRDCTIGCLDREDKLAMMRVQGAEVFLGAPLAGRWRNEQRMMRATACGSIVARLDGVDPFVPGLGLPREPSAELIPAVLDLMRDPLQGARWRHLAWRTLMSGHTLAHRLQRIADLLGTGDRFLPEDERIAALLVTMRPDRLQECIERFRNDAYPHKELVVVVHCDDIDLRPYQAMVREGEAIRICRAGTSRSLGACLNYAASQTDAPYWTKMDDDDLYGRSYLTDLMLYQKTGNHQVFGKPPIFNYLESGDELLWDVEWARHANLMHAASNAQSALVAGGTLGGKREVLDQLPFCERRRGGSDSEFIRRCYEHGIDVLAMDGFNFVRYRSAKDGFHTWNIDENEFRARSLKVGGIADMGLAMC